MVGASFPAFAVLFGEVYYVLGLEDEDEVRRETVNFSILFLIVGIVTGVGTFLQMYMFGLAGVRMTTRIRKMTFAAMLKQEMGWYDEDLNSVGALCARLSSDAGAVQGATGTRIGAILQAMSTLVLGIGLSMYYTWKMTLVSVISIDPSGAGRRVLRGQSDERSRSAGEEEDGSGHEDRHRGDLEHKNRG